MKILIIGDANSIHTIKWVKGLSQQGLTIALWSLTAPRKHVYKDVKVILADGRTEQRRIGFLSKMNYLTTLSSLRKTLRDFKPDILHAHFASSYGLLARLVNFHPTVLSVWGADVYDFPKKNFLFRQVLKGNLFFADKILSTSHVMAEQIRRYTKKNVTVTPFGVDMDIFQPSEFKFAGKYFSNQAFVVGTIKTLEEKYGISFLIQAFSIFRKRFPTDEIKLLIVGSGSQEQYLKELASSLEITADCVFTGFIPHEEVPFHHQQLDVAVFPSVLDSESFGVAAVEASASGRAVIVSDVGGLPEVVEDGITGLVVPPKNPVAIADAMALLYTNEAMRQQMGKAGRNRVLLHYNWPENVQRMIKIYEEIFAK